MAEVDNVSCLIGLRVEHYDAAMAVERSGSG
jgi:hypothetical protein